MVDMVEGACRGVLQEEESGDVVVILACGEEGSLGGDT